jgi:phosphoglycerol transferase MdoB-like AlkP superfamily enzyme
LPSILGAFRLHPALSSLSLLACIGFALLTGLVFWRFLKACLAPGETRRAYILFTLPLFILLASIGARGGLQDHPLKIGDSCISSSPYLNALCLNPVYSTFVTAVSSERQQFRFFTQEFNVRTTRGLLSCRQSPFLSDRFPLLRTSPGTKRGNRKNIVIFLLESWSGKDIGCLGGRAGVTPFFDDLARRGLLFTNFYATGVRTPEGVLSTFCSFPNEPLRPIMGMSAIYQTHWRSLSQILAEVGYRNIFIYGRDLDFAHMGDFLRFIGFHKTIDLRDFPPSAPPTQDSWPGFDDEEVMRGADEEFDRQHGAPFLGIISTMNTHPPFVIPEGFPQVLPPTSVSNKFLKMGYALHGTGYRM